MTYQNKLISPDVKKGCNGFEKSGSVNNDVTHRIKMRHASHLSCLSTLLKAGYLSHTGQKALTVNNGTRDGC